MKQFCSQALRLFRRLRTVGSVGQPLYTSQRWTTYTLLTSHAPGRLSQLPALAPTCEVSPGDSESHRRGACLHSQLNQVTFLPLGSVLAHVHCGWSFLKKPAAISARDYEAVHNPWPIPNSAFTQQNHPRWEEVPSVVSWPPRPHSARPIVSHSRMSSPLYHL